MTAQAGGATWRKRRREKNLPGVKLVNDTLEANDSEEPGAEAGQPGQEEDGERQQGLPPGRLRQAAGQTSASPAAASLHHRRAAPSIPGVRRPGVQRGFVFVVGNRVMLRHILRQSRRGTVREASYLVSHGKEKPPPLHAPLPKPRAPRPPNAPAVTRNSLT